MADVADRAGVSVQTVSNVVNGQVVVAPPTRERVSAAIRELGYHPNWTARSFRRQRSGNIGYLIRDPTARFLSRPYHLEVLAGMAEAARAHDYGVLVHGARGANPSFESLVRPIAERRVDGAVLSVSGALQERTSILDELRTAVAPFVVLDEAVRGPSLASVAAANYEGARMAVDFLLSRGRREIAMVAARIEWGDVEARISGFVDGLIAQGLPADGAVVRASRIGPDDSLVHGAEAATLGLLRARPEVDGIFAAGDEIAVGVLRAARQLRRDVPSSLAILGFEDEFLAGLMETPLTAIHVPHFEMGRRAAELLLHRIETGSFEQHEVVIPTNLIVRGSA